MDVEISFFGCLFWLSYGDEKVRSNLLGVLEGVVVFMGRVLVWIEDGMCLNFVYVVILDEVWGFCSSFSFLQGLWGFNLVLVLILDREVCFFIGIGGNPRTSVELCLYWCLWCTMYVSFECFAIYYAFCYIIFVLLVSVRLNKDLVIINLSFKKKKVWYSFSLCCINMIFMSISYPCEYPQDRLSTNF